MLAGKKSTHIFALWKWWATLMQMTFHCASWSISSLIALKMKWRSSQVCRAKKHTFFHVSLPARKGIGARAQQPRRTNKEWNYTEKAWLHFLSSNFLSLCMWSGIFFIRHAVRYGFSIKTCAINLIYEAVRKLIPGSFAVIAKKPVMRFAQPQSPHSP